MSLPRVIPESQWEMFLKELKIAGGYEVRFSREECIVFTEGEDRLWRYDLWTQERMNKLFGVYGLVPEVVLKEGLLDEPTWFLTHTNDKSA